MHTPQINPMVAKRPRVARLRYTKAHTEKCIRAYDLGDDDMEVGVEQHYFDVFVIDTCAGSWALSIERLPGIFQPMHIKMHFRSKHANKRIVQVV